MFKDFRIWIIIALLCLFIFRECSRPGKPDFADQAFKDTIEVLRQEKAIIQSRQTAITKRYSEKVKTDSINLSKQESKIQVLERKAVQQRTPRVETLIVDNPELLSFVTTQQEIITELKVEIDTLKAQKEFQRKLNEDLIIAEFQEDRAEQQMFIEQARRIDELEKQSRKKERGKRFAKLLIPVAAVAAFLVGSQL